MKKLWVLFLGLAFLCQAETTVKKEVYRGDSVYTIENQKLIISIVPSKGGRGLRFFLKEWNRELVGKDQYGFFIDHWTKHSWPSGLMHLEYSTEILRTAKGAGVRLKTIVPKMGGGKGVRTAEGSKKIETDKELQGLEIIKTIFLENGKDIVHVTQEIKNPTNFHKTAGSFFQHHFTVTKNNECFRWDIPSIDGIFGPAKERGMKVSGPFWINKPTAGWMSVSDLTKDFALVFEMDYNYLDRSYSSGTTAEWLMEPEMLPPGKSTKTEYVIYPVRGFERLCYAKDGIAAGIRADETKTGFRINIDLASRKKEWKDLDLSVRIFSHRNKNVITEKQFKVKSIGRKMQSFTLDCPEKQEVVIKAELTGKGGFKETFEYNYVDEASEHNRRFLYATIGSGASALAGGRGSAYQVKQPVKIKKIEKHDFSAIKKFPTDKNRMMVLFGLYTDHLQIFETFQNQKDVQIHWCNAHPKGIESFPSDYNALFQYRTIFMCNVNAKSLRWQGLNMLHNWIYEGGTLVITGGFFTYGNGEFEGSPFELFVPFKDLKPFDLVWSGKTSYYPLKIDKKAPEFAGVDFSGNDQVAWYHKLKLKPGAVVLARANGDPVIVKYKYGKGTVIGCTLSPMGRAPNPWWLGPGWQKFLINCSKINGGGK